MKKNIGTFDRALRFFSGLFLLGCGIYFHSWILSLVSLFVFYEAFAGWCVLYQLLGRNTCPTNKYK